MCLPASLPASLQEGRRVEILSLKYNFVSSFFRSLGERISLQQLKLNNLSDFTFQIKR